MGYSNQWRNISYGVNIARQRTTWDYDRFYHGVNEPLDVSSRQKYTETTMSFNVLYTAGLGAKTERLSP
ncbi:fimbrial outer membrane usher protein StbC [Salmonella enterica subsp. enterica]|uniref:Fimbrial outer membrane usher protein StbC n=1 Tax=Salmonella enterica I TaxID=59201 RepID=A0A3S4F8H8_SALET|nr:fimbrial outer membrane usher protein StbC [Salmonella enterica subsp. enterica]